MAVINAGAVPGAGFVGTFATSGALQTAFPAGTQGRTASVGASAPYVAYVDNGSAWVVSGGSVGGSTGQLQWNNAGVLAGIAGSSFNSGTNALTLPGALIVPSITSTNGLAGVVGVLGGGFTPAGSGTAYIRNIVSDFGISVYGTAADAVANGTTGRTASLSGSGLSIAGSASPSLAFAGSGDPLSTADTFLRRDNAANILALRNGTAAQAFRVYNTFTDSSNGEWFQVGAQITANTFTIGPRANGTGVVRPVTAVGEWTFGTTTTFSGGISNTSLAVTATSGTPSISVGNSGGLFRFVFGAGAAFLQAGSASTSDSRADLNFTSMFGTTTFLTLKGANGALGIGQTSPTAMLHVKAGTATAGTAPLKLTSGTNLTTPENGAFEFDGTNLYFTTGGTRRTVTLV